MIIPFPCRNLFLLSVCCCFLVLLTGCWDRTEINDLALVTAAGFDLKGDNDVELSIQIFIPKGGGQGQVLGGGGQGGGGQTMVKSMTGKTISDAMSRLQEQLSRQIFWGHCDVFIIGMRQARDGIPDVIDFIPRAPEPRERSYVFVSSGAAKEDLKVINPIERSSAEALRELAKSQVQMSMTVKELLELLANKDQSVPLPIIEILKSEEGDKKMQMNSLIKGTAIFKNGRLVGRVNDRVTRGVLWIRNKITRGVLTIKPKESKGLASIRLIRSRTKLQPLIKDGKWSLTVDVAMEGEVIQTTTKLKVGKVPVIAELEKQLASDIKWYITTALEQIKEGMNADVFGFDEAFHRKYPSEWKKVKGRWDEKLPEVEINTNIKTSIVRPGMTS
ncbi:Ger(x)C family spore germination protein [Paenibacillus solisilvae]|uniref:Ger(X)C family spore germination protein n=1 Tax=Paenibacillus solisilvae TaxID=2486751 RepID=A0ABW0W4V9_9BACL